MSRPPFFQRIPATTQSAVLCGLTLTTPSREPGRYGRPSLFATTPSKPGGLRASAATRVPARRRRRRARASKPSPIFSSSARRFSIGRSCTGLPFHSSRSKATNVRRDLGRELADAALGRMEAHLHRVEVERAVARDHDLAVERRVRRHQLAERPQLGEVAQQRPAVARPERELAAVVLEHAAEAVPLRLVPPAAAGRKLRDELRLHRRERDVRPGRVSHPRPT